MLIVCPSCASEYAVDPAQIGAEGSRVRCVACRSAWFAEPARMQGPRAPAARANAVPRKANRASAAPSRAVVAGALGLCLLTFGAAAVGRARVVAQWPSLAPAYAAVGLPVNPRGLAIRGVTSQVATQGTDGAFLVVEGEIANLAGRTVAVPKIEVAVQGQAGQALYTWTAAPPSPTLEAWASARFRARLAAPPAEGQQVQVRFASVAERAP